MPKPWLFRIGMLAVIVATVTLVGANALADEVQLAGVRLGAHYRTVAKVWGQPDSIITGGEGPGSIGYGGGGGAAPAAGGAGGMGGGMPGGMGGGMPGAGGPGAGGPGMMMGAGPGGGGAGGGAGAGGPRPGGAGGPGMMMGGPGAGGAGGMMGGAPGGAAAGGGGSAHTAGSRYGTETTYTDWGAVAQIPVTSKETVWCYDRGDVSMAFVLDRDGAVSAIAIAGKRCDWARTALGEPLRTVKLGDPFRRVVERYGYPQATTVEPGTGYSRDTLLHFGYNQNIDFTLRDMKVRQIYIWEAQLRGVSPGK